MAESTHHDGHPPYLQHHFDTPVQQFESGKLGMWIFLATEILLFSGLFCAYAIYRAHRPEVFIYAHQFLSTKLGGINTVVLLCSSFTMAWAVRAAQLGRQRALVVLLSLTLMGGFGFMGIKYVEYKDKWEHGLLWGQRYDPHVGHADEGHASAEEPTPQASPVPADSVSADAAELPQTERSLIGVSPRGPAGTVVAAAEPDHEAPSNVHVFFGIYFLMTGLHGVHVLAGMAAIAWLVLRAVRGDFSPQYNVPVDLVGLYWHLVDLIWIFLFPLLYLIG